METNKNWETTYQNAMRRHESIQSQMDDFRRDTWRISVSALVASGFLLSPYLMLSGIRAYLFFPGLAAVLPAIALGALMILKYTTTSTRGATAADELEIAMQWSGDEFFRAHLGVKEDGTLDETRGIYAYIAENQEKISSFLEDRKSRLRISIILLFCSAALLVADRCVSFFG